MTPSRRLQLIAALAARRVSGEQVTMKALPPVQRATIVLDHGRKRARVMGVKTTSII